MIPFPCLQNIDLIATIKNSNGVIKVHKHSVSFLIFLHLFAYLKHPLCYPIQISFLPLSLSLPLWDLYNVIFFFSPGVVQRAPLALIFLNSFFSLLFSLGVFHYSVFQATDPFFCIR